MTASKDNADSPRVEVYNLDPANPGGMKVRWRVRTVTGREAERLEKQQNQAIIKLLTWADQYLREHEETRPDGRENGRNVSVKQRENVTVMSLGRNIIRNEPHAAAKGYAA